MSVAVETLFTSALGLQPPWVVEDVKLDTAKRRIDFEIGCQAKTLGCPACGVNAQPVQQAKRAARGFRTSRNFIAIAYLDRKSTRLNSSHRT